MRLSVRFTGLTITFLIIFCLLASLLLSITHVSAATADTLSVTCTRTRIKGRTEIEADSVRVQIVLASNLMEVVATKIVSVNANGEYSAALSYSRFTTDTLLVVSVGEWDVQQEKYLMPATIQSRYCNPKGGKAPVAAPLVPLPATPAFTPIPMDINAHVEYFTADPNQITADGCTTLAYWVVGAQSLTLTNSNSTAAPEVISDNPNTRTICPSQSLGYVPGAPIVYTLDILYLNGLTERRSVTLTVAP
jgi:hypothetical protein